MRNVKKTHLAKKVLAVALFLSIVVSSGFTMPRAGEVIRDDAASSETQLPLIVEDDLSQVTQDIATDETEMSPAEETPSEYIQVEPPVDEDASFEEVAAPEQTVPQIEDMGDDELQVDEPQPTAVESSLSSVIINGTDYTRGGPVEVPGVEWDAASATLTLNGAILSSYSDFDFGDQSGTLTVTLKGANTITSDENGITVRNGNLVINAEADASLTVTAGETSNAFWTETADITLNGGTYELTGGYPVVYANGDLTVTGGANVRATNTATSNAVYAGGAITVSGASRLEAKAPSSVAIYATGACTLQDSGSEIIGESTSSNAIYAGTTLTVANGAHVKGTSTSYPAVYAETSVVVQGEGTEVTATSDSNNAVYTPGSITVENSAKLEGTSNSAIAVYSTKDLKVQNGAELKGTSTSNVGIAADGATTFDGATITANGGSTALYVDNEKPLVIKNSTLDITAGINGIYTAGGNIEITDSTINVEATNGNAISTNSSSDAAGTLTISGSKTNITTTSKAPIYAETITITEATVSTTATGGTALTANKDISISNGAHVTAKTSAKQSAIYSVSGNMDFDGKETVVDATSDLDAAIFARNGKIRLNAQVKAKAGAGMDPIAARKSAQEDKSTLPETLIEIGEDFSADGYFAAAVEWKDAGDGKFYSDSVLVPEGTQLTEQGLLPKDYTPKSSTIEVAEKPSVQEITSVAVTLNTDDLTTGNELPQATTETKGVTLKTVWKNAEGTGVDSFDEAGEYSAEISVTAAKGYVLGERVSYTVNGTPYTGSTETANVLKIEHVQVTASHIHLWAETWTSDETHHWHECEAADCDVTENSDKDEYGEHVASEEWHSDDTNHWRVCSICGKEMEKAAHTYDSDTDDTCNDCGYKRTITTPHTQQTTPTPVQPEVTPTPGTETTPEPTTKPDETITPDPTAPTNTPDVTPTPEPTATPEVTPTPGDDITPMTPPHNATVEVKPGSNAPAMQVANQNELKDMLLTAEEKQLLQDGVDVRIDFEINDANASASNMDKYNIQQVAGGYSYHIGQYLDIDLYKMIGGTRKDITETPQKVRISIAVPASLKSVNGTRSFAIIRSHSGGATLLQDLDSSNDIITFETDRFSTYAIVYKDVAQGEAVQPTPAQPTPTPDTPAPKTADNNNPGFWIALTILFGIGSIDAVCILIRKRRKN